MVLPQFASPAPRGRACRRDRRAARTSRPDPVLRALARRRRRSRAGPRGAARRGRPSSCSLSGAHLRVPRNRGLLVGARAASPASPRPLARFEPVVAGGAWRARTVGVEESRARGARIPRWARQRGVVVALGPDYDARLHRDLAHLLPRRTRLRGTATEEAAQLFFGGGAASPRPSRPFALFGPDPRSRFEPFVARVALRACRRERRAARTSRPDVVFRAPAAPSSITAGPRRRGSRRLPRCSCGSSRPLAPFESLVMWARIVQPRLAAPCASATDGARQRVASGIRPASGSISYARTT